MKSASVAQFDRSCSQPIYCSRIFHVSGRNVIARYGWPGNVRELQNVGEQLVWIATADRPVEPAELPDLLRALPALTAAPNAGINSRTISTKP